MTYSARKTETAVEIVNTDMTPEGVAALARHDWDALTDDKFTRETVESWEYTGDDDGAVALLRSHGWTPQGVFWTSAQGHTVSVLNVDAHPAATLAALTLGSDPELIMDRFADPARRRYMDDPADWIRVAHALADHPEVDTEGRAELAHQAYHRCTPSQTRAALFYKNGKPRTRGSSEYQTWTRVAEVPVRPGTIESLYDVDLSIPDEMCADLNDSGLGSCARFN